MYIVGTLHGRAHDETADTFADPTRPLEHLARELWPPGHRAMTFVFAVEGESLFVFATDPTIRTQVVNKAWHLKDYALVHKAIATIILQRMRGAAHGWRDEPPPPLPVPWAAPAGEIAREFAAATFAFAQLSNAALREANEIEP